MSVDLGMRQSLVEAGLVDPSSGEFTSAPNFGAAPEGESPRDPLPDLPDDAVRPEEKPAEQPQPRPNEPTQPRTETVESPASPPSAAADPSHDASKLGAEADPIRQNYESTVSNLRRDANMALMYGRTLTNEDGTRMYTDEQLQGFIGQQLQMAEHQAYLAGVMERMQPVAKRAAAEKFAKEYGVEVDDIVNEPNPVAMETRAKTIADLVRDGRFQKRKEEGRDTAEGSRSFNNAIPEAIDKLSPQQKIYAGLARGDR
jgi:hypothetical protein